MSRLIDSWNWSKELKAQILSELLEDQNVISEVQRRKQEEDEMTEIAREIANRRNGFGAFANEKKKLF